MRSINCAFSRLAQIVGLNRMVDTVYRMAANPYLYRGQSPEDRVPIQPYGAFSIGANEMSTLDMASGIQTIANEGVHMQPYFVEYIDDATGEPRINTDVEVGERVAIIAVRRRAHFDTPEGIAAMGPRHWGFDLDFQPLESLVEN